MQSDDASFASRQVDRLFEQLLQMHGKIRVVLPDVEPVKKQEPIKIPESVRLAEEIKKESYVNAQITEEKESLKVVETEKIAKIPDLEIKDTEATPSLDERLPDFNLEREVKENEPVSLKKKKSGFVSRVSFEPEIQIKPVDVVSKEDEELVKIIDEKIKKSLPEEETPFYEIEEPEEEFIIPEIALIGEEIGFEEQENEVIVEQNTYKDFKDLVAAKKPIAKIDYLILAAYYLQSSEDIYKFSLKQINTKVMPFLGSLIDHSVVHEAISKDYIEVVPDYNGTAEVTEYKLTIEGENYILSS